MKDNIVNNQRVNFYEKSFEGKRHRDQKFNEFWFARDMQELLEYSSWTVFKRVIKKAQLACENSGSDILDHFRLTTREISLFGVLFKEAVDYKLSRFACYLIIQNADPKYPKVAQAQSYLAQRMQEFYISSQSLREDLKRVEIRSYLQQENTKLSKIAKKSGVSSKEDFSEFYNKGYAGLYGGLTVKEIHQRKHLQDSQKILDHMNSTELAANLFRVTQTQDSLQRQDIKNAKIAQDIHFEVGRRIRNTIQELGGTNIENLPTPVKSVKEIAQELESLKKHSYLKLK